MMIKLNKIVLMSVVATLLSVASSGVWAEDGGALDQPVCSTNDYAMCSHAQCDCIDESGAPGACVMGGLAQCTCPVVINDSSADDLQTKAYNNNFGLLRSCKERTSPKDTAVLPAFVNDGTAVPDVYSEYSYGDSIEGNKFATLSSAELMICKDLPMMADCLDAPCIVGDDGIATCYCRNATLVINQKAVPWNTVGGDCDQSNCDLGNDRVWSAAYIEGTKSAIAAISVMLDDDKQMQPSYCAK